MAGLYDITEWNEQSWWNTGGTRDKKIYLNPEDGQLYFFKQSFKKGERDFKHEFWSEIIASEIGILLGFEILPYHIALRGSVAGCISKSMINQESQELVEGGKYLQAYSPSFNPENTKERHQYSFQLIESALRSFNKEKHLIELLEIFVFDALIGNSDRHQENWATIVTHGAISSSLSEIQNDITTGNSDSWPKWFKKMINILYPESENRRPELDKAIIRLTKETVLAPIYDSGCSFGRELDDQRVYLCLNNNEELHKYIEKGLAEIHWEGKKINHFELIIQLLETTAHKDHVLATLKRTIERFDSVVVSKVVMDIDKPLQSINTNYCLPQVRKELVLKLLNSRLNRLKAIYDQYQ